MSEALKRFNVYDENSLNACRSISRTIYYLRDIMGASERERELRITAKYARDFESYSQRD